MARLRAMHHGHDAARILTDAMPNVEPAYGQAYTSVVGGLSPWNAISPILEPKA